jgi:hypothetical protein
MESAERKTVHKIFLENESDTDDRRGAYRGEALEYSQGTKLFGDVAPRHSGHG